MSKRLDMGRLRQLTSGPGTDTRYMLVLAVVDKVVVDPREGIFCDISFLPMEEPETAQLGVPYAGNGFGFYFPVEEDDIVLVAIPDGDPGAGPVIISRIWNAADKPIAESAGAADPDIGPGQYRPSGDVILKTKSGASFKTLISGGGNAETAVTGGGKIGLSTSGGGHVEINAAGGAVVKLQDASQAFVRGDDFDTHIDTYVDAVKTYTVGVAAVVAAINTWVSTTPTLFAFPTSAALITALTTTFTPITANLAVATTAFKASSAAWLSSRVKGQ